MDDSIRVQITRLVSHAESERVTRESQNHIILESLKAVREDVAEVKTRMNLACEKLVEHKLDPEAHGIGGIRKQDGQRIAMAGLAVSVLTLVALMAQVVRHH